MLDYKQAHEIRVKYPKKLTDSQIDEIIAIWEKEGIERVDMLDFSAMYDMRTIKSTVCDFKLSLKSQAHFHYLYFKNIAGECLHSSVGMLLWAYVENLSAFNDSWCIKKQGKKKADIRRNTVKTLIEKVYALYPEGVKEGFDTMFDIKNTVKQKFNTKFDSWQQQIIDITKKIIE